MQVPPLRERGDDIVRLATTFANRYAQGLGRTLQPFSPDCIRRLRAYSWPGIAYFHSSLRPLKRGNFIRGRTLPSTSWKRTHIAARPARNAIAVDEGQLRDGERFLALRKSAYLIVHYTKGKDARRVAQSSTVRRPGGGLLCSLPPVLSLGFTDAWTRSSGRISRCGSFLGSKFSEIWASASRCARWLSSFDSRIGRPWFLARLSIQQSAIDESPRLWPPPTSECTPRNQTSSSRPFVAGPSFGASGRVSGKFPRRSSSAIAWQHWRTVPGSVSVQPMLISLPGKPNEATVSHIPRNRTSAPFSSFTSLAKWRAIAAPRLNPMTSIV